MTTGRASRPSTRTTCTSRSTGCASSSGTTRSSQLLPGQVAEHVPVAGVAAGRVETGAAGHLADERQQVVGVPDDADPAVRDRRRHAERLGQVALDALPDLRVALAAVGVGGVAVQVAEAAREQAAV